MTQGDIRTLTLPSNVTKLEAAAIAIQHGGLAYPVEMGSHEFEPVAAFVGATKSAWRLATRDLKRIGELLEANPAATVGVRIPTPYGFDRYFALKGNAFVEIPAIVYR